MSDLPATGTAEALAQIGQNSDARPVLLLADETAPYLAVGGTRQGKAAAANVLDAMKRLRAPKEQD